MEWSHQKVNQNQEMAEQINTSEYKKWQRKPNKTQNRKLKVSIRKMENV
jgi:hypothetical protein